MLDLSEVTSGLHASALDTAGYLGAIMERIGEARFNKIIGTEGMLMLEQRGFVHP